MPIPVSDPADPRLADFRDLTAADRRPDRPGGRGLVLAEGVPVVRRLLASPYPVRAVLGVPAKLADLAADLADYRPPAGPGAHAYGSRADGAGGRADGGRADGTAGHRAGVPAYEVSAGLMAEVVGFHLNRGVLASADRAPAPAAAALLATARRAVVLEGVNDHENLGAIFRNAAALGADAVLLGPRCADPLYRRSVRVSMGHVLRVPFAPVSTLDLPGFTTVALAPHPPAVPLSTVDPATPRVALLAGAEGPGLTPETLVAADVRARIPMDPGVDSLNVATALAIALHHFTRHPSPPPRRS